jgi:hypothetical protein
VLRITLGDVAQRATRGDRGGRAGNACDFLVVSIAKTPGISFEFGRGGNSRLRIDPG